MAKVVEIVASKNAKGDLVTVVPEQDLKTKQSSSQPIVKEKTPFQEKWDKALTIEEARESSLQFVRSLWNK